MKPKRKPAKIQESSQQISVIERGVALTFAGSVLATLIVLVLNPNLVNESTLAIIRFLAAIFAGISGYLFSGQVNLEAYVPFTKTQLRATGAFAAFITVFLLFFYSVPSENNFSVGSLNNEEAKVNIEQFALNKKASPYFEICNLKNTEFSVDSPAVKLSAVKEISLTPLGGELLNLALFEKPQERWTKFREWILYLRNQPDELKQVEREIKLLPEDIRTELSLGQLGDSTKIITGLNPVFDLTFTNHGSRAVVLTGAEVVLETGGATGDIAPIGVAPLAVSHRYIIDILEDDEVALIPPIQLSSDKPIRIQMQVTSDNDIGWHNSGYLFRLKFNFGDKLSATTEQVIVLHDRSRIKCNKS